MKQQLSPGFFALLLLFSFLSACKKENFQQPNPVPPTDPANRSVQIEFSELPGQQGAVAGLYVLVSISDDQDHSVCAEKKLSLSYDGRYITDSFSLPAGAYRLKQLVVVSSDSSVRFAAPLTNSPKASFVSQALPLAFHLSSSSLVRLTVPVLRVQETDAPESFGYPAGYFRRPSQPGGQDPYVRIRVRAEVTIGSITYDSIPAGLMITAWDEANNMTRQHGELMAGTNQLVLSRNKARYEIEVSHFGVTARMEIRPSQVSPDSLFVIGGSRQAKLLKTELDYLLVEGHYKAQKKTVYEYGDGGRLSRILYYQKKSDGTPYLAFTDQFRYGNNGVDKTIRFDSSNLVSGELSFFYDGAGRLSGMKNEEAGITTTASVHDLSPAPSTSLRYTYSHNAITMYHNQLFEKGNLVQLSAATSHQNSETGHFQYDLNINPYVHMNWPDLFLSHRSKNNLIGQQKQYIGSYPTAEPYKFDYTYDADGYPKECITRYKSYLTGQHLFTIKTVYTY